MTTAAKEAGKPMIDQSRKCRWSLLVAAVAWSAGCQSVEVSGGLTELSNITGTYSGLQSGMHGTLTFTDDIIQFTFVQDGTDLTGTWFGEVENGTLTGVVDDQGDAFEFTMTMTQEVPCEGSYEGTGEARLGTLNSGGQTIGIAGSFQGMDCDGDYTADFFVEILF